MYRLLYAAPFWLFLGLAIAVAGLTELIVENDKQVSADKAIAVKQPVPPAVDLSEFNKNNDLHLLDEVHVGGWLNADYNTHLIRTKNGTKRSEGYLMVLFGAEDTKETKVAKAAFILSEANKDQFFDPASKVSNLGGTSEGLGFTVNGRAQDRISLSSMAKDTMKDNGLTLSENFIFIVPYWKGRAAAFAPKPLRSGDTRQVGYGIAVFLAMIGMIKYLRKTKRVSQPPRFGDPVNDYRGNTALPVPATSRRAPLDPPRYETGVGALDHAEASDTPQQPSKKRRFPNWLIGLVVVIVTFRILPPGYAGLIVPLLMLATGLFVAKKVLDGLGVATHGAFGAVSGLLGTPGPKRKKGNPFDRLS